jgi:phosphate transport system protein
MLRELLTIFRSGDPLASMGSDFTKMLALSRDLTLEAGVVYFGSEVNAEERTRLFKQDVAINKLERKIRKRVIAHLSFPGNQPSVPYCLLLMSLVKDVERIGDYAKNLMETVDLRGGPPPSDEMMAELAEIRAGVEETFAATANVFTQSDRDRAVDLIDEGKSLAGRCDALVERIAKSDYEARAATAAVLGTRYYKRIGGHLLNVLTSVVMPLHKLDYYDEKHATPEMPSGA